MRKGAMAQQIVLVVETKAGRRRSLRGGDWSQCESLRATDETIVTAPQGGLQGWYLLGIPRFYPHGDVAHARSWNAPPRLGGN